MGLRSYSVTGRVDPPHHTAPDEVSGEAGQAERVSNNYDSTQPRGSAPLRLSKRARLMKGEKWGEAGNE